MIQSVASSVGIEVVPVNVRDADEIERAVTAFARTAGGGLMVTASALTLVHRDRIVALAAKLRLPAVYPRRVYVESGGLVSYGFDVVDQFHRAAGYVDRILKGEKPADLPVQAADQIRAGDQPQDREGARPRRPADATRPRRRGDRITEQEGRDETSLAPGQVQKRRMDDLKPFIAIQRVQLPPGKGEPASRKRALHGWWQHHS